MTVSPHWRTPLGEITCTTCGGAWPCHWSAWNMGGRRCLRCRQETLEWEPDQ